MNRGRAAVAGMIVCVLAALAPASAAARVAYFTGSGEAGPYIAPIDLGTGALGTKIPVSSEGPPFDVAITPDGSTAYVPVGEELVGVDVATNTESRSIPTPGVEAAAVAISPDGTRAYTANYGGSVSTFDLATRAEVGAPVVVPGHPEAIAVTPDGTRAYLADQNLNTVTVVDLATGTVIATIPVGERPVSLAITPDGSAVYVAAAVPETVTRIDTATNTVTAVIPVGPAERIAISPDGSHAYVVGPVSGSTPQESALTPVDLATGTAGAAVLMSGYANDVAVLPDGSRAYAVDNDEQHFHVAHLLLPFDPSTNMLETGLELYERPFALAIVPNQPPHAAIAGPATATTGEELSFDGSGSTDSDGTVARYDWEFGDGTGAANGGPTVRHAYANPGTYQVTLTTTDNEGCSTQLVFTGQTASCNGSGVARTTQQVTVTAPVVPGKCPAVRGKATSFKPKIRPGHIVPGVRVRLAVGTPSRLVVNAKLLWQHQGDKHRTKLRKLSVNVNRWRRVRFPIPSQLRKLLPLGRRVTLELTIRAVPRSGSTCSATTTRKKLHVRVVKVFPNAVQAHRPR